MGRLGFGIALALIVSSPLLAQPAVPACQGTRAAGERDTIVLDENGRIVTTPRNFFSDAPTTAAYYGFRSERSRTGALIEAIWSPPARLPATITLPTRNGFIDTDPGTTGLYERLKAALLKVVPIRYVDRDAAAVVQVRVEDLSAATADRDALLQGKVTFRVDTLRANCAVGDVIHMDSREYRDEIRQLCASVQECADNIADKIAHWIEQNFGLAYEKSR